MSLPLSYESYLHFYFALDRGYSARAWGLGPN